MDARRWPIKEECLLTVHTFCESSKILEGDCLLLLLLLLTADMNFMKSVTFFPFYFLTAIVWSQFARTCMYVCMHVLLSMLYMHIHFVNSTCTCIHI